MCLSISGSCLNAPRITNVRTFHCGGYPGTLVALFRINNNTRKTEEIITIIVPKPAAQRAGLLAVFCDEFLRNSSSVHVDNRTDSAGRNVSISLSAGCFQRNADCGGVFSTLTLD